MSFSEYADVVNLSQMATQHANSLNPNVGLQKEKKKISAVLRFVRFHKSVE
jgi:hypothetical protein